MRCRTYQRSRPGKHEERAGPHRVDGDLEPGAAVEQWLVGGVVDALHGGSGEDDQRRRTEPDPAMTDRDDGGAGECHPPPTMRRALGRSSRNAVARTTLKTGAVATNRLAVPAGTTRSPALSSS